MLVRIPPQLLLVLERRHRKVYETPEPLEYRSRPLGVLPPAVRPVIAVHRDQRPRLSCRLEGRRKSVEPTLAIKRQCDPGKIDERGLPELIRNPVGIGQLEQFPGGSTVAPVPERPLPIRSRLDQVKTWKAPNGSYEIGTNGFALCRPEPALGSSPTAVA